MADEQVRYNEYGVALGKEEGDPAEILDDPFFEAGFQEDLVDLGRRWGIPELLAARRAELATSKRRSPKAARRARRAMPTIGSDAAATE